MDPELSGSITNDNAVEIYQKDEDALKNTSVDDSLGPAVHRPSRGAELIPYSLLEQSLANVIAACAVLNVATGFLLILMGGLVHGLMLHFATKQGPVLWWAGIGPFVLGIYGLKSSSDRSRRKVYAWGTCTMLLAVTQTAIMGWAGNYTTSHYDVWPLHEKRNGQVVCHTLGTECLCQDYYHGVYSSMELPGVEYIYRDGIKWRKTVYDSCSHLGALTALFWSFHVAWVLFALSSFIACGLGMAGSVCAKQTEDFQKLQADEDDNENSTRQLEEDPEGSVVDGRLEVVYSEFDRY